MKLSGNPIALHGTFTQANVNAGLVTYVNAGGGGSNDSFGFTVQDVSGTPTAAQTFTITVHDQGIVTLLANTGLTLNENATATVTSAELAYTDNGGAFNGPGRRANHFHLDDRSRLALWNSVVRRSPSTAPSPRPTSTPAS